MREVIYKVLAVKDPSGMRMECQSSSKKIVYATAAEPFEREGFRFCCVRVKDRRFLCLIAKPPDGRYNPIFDSERG